MQMLIGQPLGVVADHHLLHHIVGRDPLAGLIGPHALHTETQLLRCRLLCVTRRPAGVFVDIPVLLRHGDLLLFGVKLS